MTIRRADSGKGRNSTEQPMQRKKIAKFSENMGSPKTPTRFGSWDLPPPPPPERSEDPPSESDSPPPPSRKPSLASDKAPQKGRSLNDKWWLVAFLFHTTVYMGASAYINYSAMTYVQQPTGEENGMGPIDVDDLILVCGAIVTGLGAAFMAFAVVVFVPRWYFLAVLGAILIASGGPLGSSVGAELYHTGILVLGTITLGGVVFWPMRSGGVRNTVLMFQTFRELCEKRSRIYWLIIAWTILQAALELWCTVSVAAVITRFQPESQLCAGSICGWGIVSGLICGFVIAQAWLAATLSEILNAVVSASAFAKGLKGERQLIGGSLKNACYRSLGSLAKNALFADLVDALVWPLTALDRVPRVNKTFAKLSSWYLRWLCGAMEKYNKFIGVTIALKHFEIDHVTAQGMSQTLVKYGNTCKDLDDHDSIGQPMGPITKELRAAGNGVEGLKKEHWKTGLGAFMGSHNSKSLLVAGAFACGVIAGGAVYSAMIYDMEGTDIPLELWDWAMVGWAFVSSLTIAYHLLMVMETSICRVYALILLTDEAGQVAEICGSLRQLLDVEKDGMSKWEDLKRVKPLAL